MGISKAALAALSLVKKHPAVPAAAAAGFGMKIATGVPGYTTDMLRTLYPNNMTPAGGGSVTNPAAPGANPISGVKFNFKRK